MVVLEKIWYIDVELFSLENKDLWRYSNAKNNRNDHIGKKTVVAKDQ